MDEGSTIQCCLGIDIGTTSVKITMIDVDNKSISNEVQLQTNADVECADIQCAFEQDVSKIFASIEGCLQEMSSKVPMHNITAIGVSGQMHGLVLWKRQTSHAEKPISLDCTSASHLITWRDQRCSVEFLDSLPPTQSHLHLSTGYGCASMFWLLKNSPDVFRTEGYDSTGTIMDYVVSILCGLDKPVMTTQNAASWGYFDVHKSSWNLSVLEEVGFPVHLLPKVVAPGSCAGHLRSDFHNIRKGTPVLAALGDLQCAVISSLTADRQAVLNFSTSSQLCFPVEDFNPPMKASPSPVEYIPYMKDGQYLAVAASLNGGNVLSSLVKSMQRWMRKLEFNTEESALWETLIEAANDAPLTDLIISPTLFGERHAPDIMASISNITESNMDLGIIFKGLCYALVKNLREMMTDVHLNDAVTTIKATGSAMSRNPILREAVVDLFQGFHVEFGNSCDSAYGAALTALSLIS